MTSPTSGAPATLSLNDAVKKAQDHYAQNRLAEAEHVAKAIIAKRPGHIIAVQILAGVAEKRGDAERAIALLQGSLSGMNGDALSLMNLCRIFRIRGRLDESREAGERAVAFGTVPEAFVDLADTYAALGDAARAQALFEGAIARSPNMARAHMGLAQCLLRNGEFRPGWASYEWRYKLPSTKSLLPKFTQATWNGMRLTDSRLLVICEQGFGDCFQFARYLPMVGERVRHVYVGASAELRAVIERVKGTHTCYQRWEDVPPFEFQITLSSLPFVFGTTAETIPRDVPYLSADPVKVDAWRARLAAHAFGRKTVGIVWRGRPTHPLDGVRSMALSQLTPVLELEGILPVSLQVGAGREQLAEHPSRARVFDAADELQTFDDTAALVSALDCVVTIDSVAAHLTGGLGKPGYVLLPKVADWRWLQERSDSPWYPTLELLRQDTSGAWDGAVARVAERLRGL